jgi:hypothetical protein
VEKYETTLAGPGGCGQNIPGVIHFTAKINTIGRCEEGQTGRLGAPRERIASAQSNRRTQWKEINLKWWSRGRLFARSYGAL